MNVLQQIRASVAQEAPSAPSPVSSTAPSPAGPSGAPPGPSAGHPRPGAIAPLWPSAGHPRPCPFAFGDWLPRTDPEAQPGEAQRAVLLGGAVVAWWRREWVPPLPIPTYTPPITLEPFQRHAVYLPDGREVEASCSAQTALERLAARLGV